MTGSVSQDSAPISNPDYNDSDELNLPGIRPFNTLERSLYWVYILSFSLDFRGPAGGSASQYIMMAVCFFSAFSLIIFGPHKKGPASLHRIILYMLIFCSSTFIPLIAYGVPLDRYVRVAGPFFLFTTSLYIVYFMASRKVLLTELLYPILIGGLISWAWSILYAVSFQDVAIDSMRYQLLSPAQPLLIAFAFAALISGRWNTMGVICLIGSILSSLISVTRQYIISYVLLLFFLFWILMRSELPAKERITRFKKALVILCSIIIIGLSFTVILRPDTFNTWYQRLFVLNDISNNTGLMRLAQTYGSWDELLNHPVYLLTGKGMGSTFYWDSTYQSYLQYYGIEVNWVHADVMWDGIFHTSGILFGGLFTYMLLCSLKSAFRITRVFTFRGSINARIWGTVPFAFVLQIFATSFFSNPWYNRFYAILAGILIGSLFWMNEYIHSSPIYHKNQS
jgi:hypothetical protein